MASLAPIPPRAEAASPRRSGSLRSAINRGDGRLRVIAQEPQGPQGDDPGLAIGSVEPLQQRGDGGRADRAEGCVIPRRPRLAFALPVVEARPARGLRVVGRLRVGQRRDQGGDGGPGPCSQRLERQRRAAADLRVAVAQGADRAAQRLRGQPRPGPRRRVRGSRGRATAAPRSMRGWTTAPRDRSDSASNRPSTAPVLSLSCNRSISTGMAGSPRAASAYTTTGQRRSAPARRLATSAGITTLGSGFATWSAQAAAVRTPLSGSFSADTRAGTAGLAGGPIRCSTSAVSFRTFGSRSDRPAMSAGTAGAARGPSRSSRWSAWSRAFGSSPRQSFQRGGHSTVGGFRLLCHLRLSRVGPRPGVRLKKTEKRMPSPLEHGNESPRPIAVRMQGGHGQSPPVIDVFRSRQIRTAS